MSIDDDFTKERFAWLNRIATDGEIRPQGFRVAFAIASLFLNREKREAWPSQQTLADTLSVEVKTIQREIKALVSRGYLIVEKTGIYNSHRYRLNTTSVSRSNTTSVSRSEDQTRHPCPANTTSVSPQTPQGCPTNLLNEPSENLLNISEAFKEFWSVFPKRTGKPKALKAYSEIVSSGKATTETLNAAAKRYAAEAKYRETWPASWLEDESWRDWVPADAMSEDRKREIWARSLRDYIDTGGHWVGRTPEPGMPDCWIPLEFVRSYCAEHGLRMPNERRYRPEDDPIYRNVL